MKVKITKKYRQEKSVLLSGLSEPMLETLKKSRAIVAGGAISSVFTGRKIKDLDIYFRSPVDLRVFLLSIENHNIQILGKSKYSLTIQEYQDEKRSAIVQAVYFDFFENAKKIFDRFDFTCTMGAYDFDDDAFHFDESFFIDNAKRVLVYNEKTFSPMRTLIRVEKYKQYGYKISYSEVLRILISCMSLDVQTVGDVKEYLGGMYGLDLSSLFGSDDDLPITWDSVAEALKNVFVSPKYFDMEPFTEQIYISDWNNFVFECTKIPRRFFVFNGQAYLEDSIRGQWIERWSITYIMNLENNSAYEEIKDFPVNTSKIYKYVELKDDGTLCSFWERNGERLEYVVGETVIPTFGDKRIYASYIYGVMGASYSNAKNSVLIEMEYDEEDVILRGELNGTITVKKARVLRVVPRNEVAKLCENGCKIIEDDLPF